MCAMYVLSNLKRFGNPFGSVGGFKNAFGSVGRRDAGSVVCKGLLGKGQPN